MASRLKLVAGDLNGAVVPSIPQLGQLLWVEKGGRYVDVGQVTSAAYEEGGGSGFVVHATSIAHDDELFVKLAEQAVRIPLRF